MPVPKSRRARDDKRSADHGYEVGVQGRKTGITLPQGARDEHGIEDLDGIFSSPEKPAPQRNGVLNGDKTLTSSEEMQIAQSSSPTPSAYHVRNADPEDEGSAPEPTEVLSTRRVTLKSTRTTLPPPTGKSPYKTNIGSSPRRQSSVKPRRQTSDTPESLQPRPTVTRRLDFGEQVSSLRKPAKRKSTGGPISARKSDIYDLPVTEDEDAADLPMQEAEESLAFVQDDVYDGGVLEPSETEAVSSPTRRRASGRTSRVEQDEEEEVEEPEPVVQKKGKGRLPTRRSLAEVEEEEEPQSSRVVAKSAPRRGGKAQLRSTKAPVEDDSAVDPDESSLSTSFTKPAPRPTKGKGRTRQLPTPEDTQPHPDDPVETTELDESTIIEPAPASKRAAKAANKGKRKVDVYQEPYPAQEEVLDTSAIPPAGEATEITEDERPAKRAKPAAKTKKAATTKKTAARGGAPKERSTNIPSSSTTAVAPGFKKPSLPLAPKGSGDRWDESMWANSRNMSRLRDPTPSAEAMVGRTRSGRQVIKPLNHFANERAQYGRDGTLLAVQTAEIVEKPISEAQVRSRSKAGSRVSGRNASRAASRRRPEVIAEEDEGEEGEDIDPEAEDWEVNGELIYGLVHGYDVRTGQTTDETFETELAFAPTSIPLMPVSSANFGFAKLLSMPFFGSGIMDFPVGGFKKPRNSGKTSLHVFVHTGRVWVRIGGRSGAQSGNRFKRGREEEAVGTEFRVGRGGSFHIPRGNLYEIRNISNRNSRLFFAQGTELVAADS